MPSSFFTGTSQQLEVIRAILKSVDEGELLDYPGLRLKLTFGQDYPTPEQSRSALKQITDNLKRRGFIETEYRKKRAFFKPTLLAYHVFRPTPGHI